MSVAELLYFYVALSQRVRYASARGNVNCTETNFKIPDGAATILQIPSLPPHSDGQALIGTNEIMLKKRAWF
jgi:hypothetical protein